jgi:hypothetical protein
MNEPLPSGKGEKGGLASLQSADGVSSERKLIRLEEENHGYSTRCRRRGHARGHARDGEALFALVLAARRLALIYPLLASVAMVYLLGWVLIVSGVLQASG